MGTPEEGLSAFRDVANIINTAPQSDADRRREEINRKKREYRARKKAEETDEQREERNRKQRDYRARQKANSLTPIPATFQSRHHVAYYGHRANFSVSTPSILGKHSTPSSGGQQSPAGTGRSTVLQASIINDKENIDPDDPNDWLHRNPNYVRRCQRTNDPPTSDREILCTKMSWTGEKLDGNAPRTKFLVEMLKYKDNESKDNIPEDIQELIRRVRI